VSYQILILRRAQKELAALAKGEYERTRDAIAALAADPRPPGSKKLVDRDGWRIRSGSNRVIYTIDDPQKKVTVLNVGHRRDIY